MIDEMSESELILNGDKKKNTRELQLVQEIDEFQIFRTPTCFVLRLPKNRFGGYFISLSGVFRQIARFSLIDKLIARTKEEKRDIDSFCKFVSDHEEYVNELAKKFDEINIRTNEK